MNFHFLRAKEVRGTLQALDNLFENAPDGIHSRKHEIKKTCSGLIKKSSDDIAYQIRVNSQSPHSLASSIAIRTTEALLLSGQLHIYRGLLSPAGSNLNSLLRFLVKANVGANGISQLEADEFLQYVEDEIRHIG